MEKQNSSKPSCQSQANSKINIAPFLLLTKGSTSRVCPPSKQVPITNKNIYVFKHSATAMFFSFIYLNYICVGISCCFVHDTFIGSAATDHESPFTFDYLQTCMYCHGRLAVAGLKLHAEINHSARCSPNLPFHCKVLHENKQANTSPLPEHHPVGCQVGYVNVQSFWDIEAIMFSCQPSYLDNGTASRESLSQRPYAVDILTGIFLWRQL